MMPGRILFLVLVALLALVALAGCGEADPSGPSSDPRPTGLSGTRWRVVGINQRLPIAGSEPTAVFAATQVSGSGGCNHYGGAYAFDASSGAIAFREMGMTAMACAEAPKNEFETLFMQTMGQVNSAAIDPAGRLVLSGPAGQVFLVRVAGPVVTPAAS